MLSSFASEGKNSTNHNEIFWLIEESLRFFIFDESSKIGVAKSGKTYNHKKLWEANNGFGTNKPFDYYPRGRVEYTNNGTPIIYMSPHIGSCYIDLIMNEFVITVPAKIQYDYSAHYHCYLDMQY